MNIAAARAAARHGSTISSRPRRSIPTSATRLTPEQERFYLASQWKLMWWKFKRHRVAVVSGDHPAAHVRVDAGHRGAGAVQPAHAAHRLHLRAAAERALVPRGQLRRALRLRARRRRSTWRRCAATTPRTPRSRTRCASSAPATPTSSGDWSRRRSTSSARRKARTLFLLGTDRLGRDVLSRIIYGARISLTIGLHRHRDQLRARAHHRRHRRLLRRLGRSRDPARHRGHPLVPRTAAVDGAVRGAAGDVEPDPHLLRHHRDPGACSTGPASRARCARSCSRCARRTTARPRG